MRRQVTDWDKLLVKGTYDKEMFSKIYKEVLKFNNKTNNSILKIGRNLKRDIQVANKHEKMFHIIYHQRNAN